MRPVPPYRVFIGWDAAEMQAYRVAEFSMRTHASRELHIERITMSPLQASGVYDRDTEVRTLNGKSMIWDVLSDAPMSTSHAIARFFIPHLMNYQGWALFTDGDIVVRQDIAQLFALADPACAVQVVKHAHHPGPHDGLKKDGQVQTIYPRKNWSSVILWNCAHPAHRTLSLEVLNSWPGRDLHAFNWLPDPTIGELPARWNYLVGVNPLMPEADVAIAHFTLGTPNVKGHEHDPFSDEWYAVAKGAGYKLAREAVA